MAFNNSSDVFLSSLYERDWSMALALLAAVLNITLITPLSCIIVWYERFGSDLRRTLLNQLVASLCWNIIFQNLATQPMEVFLTLYGPLDPWFCFIHAVLKFSCFFHWVVIIFFMALVKYLSIFLLQNPMSIKSEFWYLVINLVTVILCVLSQLVYYAMPGRKPNNYYVCIGEDPSHLEHQRVLRNIPITLTIVVTFIFQPFTLIKIKLYERRAKSRVGPQDTRASQRPVQQAMLVGLKSMSLILVLFVLMVAVYSIINFAPAKELNSKPWLMVIHFFHHGIELVLNSTIIAVFCLKSKHLRASIKQILMKFFNEFVLCKIQPVVVID